MLKGISPLISPDLLDVMYRMGHGDELVLADAHFPSDTLGKRVVRADGLAIAPLLDAILPLFVLDSYVDAPVMMMAAVTGDRLDPQVELDYRRPIDLHCSEEIIEEIIIERLERFQFYDRVKSAFAVVATGETRKYGNIILKKGVTPIL